MSLDQNYRNYYLSQAGYGWSPAIYQGTRIQRGYGLGGFFSSLFRSAVPMLKQGAKAASKALIKTGLDVASDAIAGKNIKESARQHFKQTGRDLANRAVGHLRGQLGSGPLVFIKRKRLHTKKKKSTKRHKKDIFS